MSLSTKSTLNRQEKTEELIKYHQWKFDLLQDDKPVFIPKCAYVPKGKSEYHIGFFLSEMKKGKDIYTEFTSIELDPEDANRTLYKWRYNPHYEEEYDKSDSLPNGQYRYLVPVAELVKIEFDAQVDEPGEVNPFPDFDEIMDPDADAPFSQMTVRDLAAILLKKPVSHKKWLNDLIQ